MKKYLLFIEWGFLNYTLYKQIRIWEIPEGGLTSNMNECQHELIGHKRKVLHIEWHPTATNVLISAGFDHAVSFS